MPTIQHTGLTGIIHGSRSASFRKANAHLLVPQMPSGLVPGVPSVGPQKDAGCPPDGLKTQGMAVSDGFEQVITLPYPPSANAYWRSIVVKGAVRVLLSTEARRYKKAVAPLALIAGLTPLTGPVGLHLAVYRPARRGDLSNRIKVVEDALQGYAYVNDSQIEHIEAVRFDDKANPRVVVRVRSLR